MAVTVWCSVGAALPAESWLPSGGDTSCPTTLFDDGVSADGCGPDDGAAVSAWAVGFGVDLRPGVRRLGVAVSGLEFALPAVVGPRPLRASAAGVLAPEESAGGAPASPALGADRGLCDGAAEVPVPPDPGDPVVVPVPVSAAATAGAPTMTTPTPSATANAPTRPTCGVDRLTGANVHRPNSSSTGRTVPVVSRCRPLAVRPRRRGPDDGAPEMSSPFIHDHRDGRSRRCHVRQPGYLGTTGCSPWNTATIQPSSRRLPGCAQQIPPEKYHTMTNATRRIGGPGASAPGLPNAKCRTRERAVTPIFQLRDRRLAEAVVGNVLSAETLAVE